MLSESLSPPPSLKLPQLPSGQEITKDKEVIASNKQTNPNGSILEIVGSPHSPHEFTLRINNVPTDALKSGIRIGQILHFTRAEDNLLSWINFNYRYLISLVDGKLTLSKANF